jgi:hypothetical protein
MRAAITDRARSASAVDPSISLDRRLRQFAYHRLLTRLFTADPDHWILKGGVALLTRLPNARHSRDIDLARTSPSLEEAVDALARAGALDLGDYFEFRVDQGLRPLTGPHLGGTITVTAYLGPREFARFNVDIVTGVTITAAPERIAAQSPVEIPGLVEVEWYAYPLVDHLADKFAAILERHGDDRQTSSRYRDLVDIAIIATSVAVNGVSLRTAILTEFDHRSLPVPSTFAVPDQTAWRAGYDALAKDLPTLRTLPFENAEALASDLFAASTSDQGSGTWDPVRGRWA